MTVKVPGFKLSKVHNRNDFVRGPFSVFAARCAFGLQQRALELRNVELPVSACSGWEFFAAPSPVSSQGWGAKDVILGQFRLKEMLGRPGNSLPCHLGQDWI